MRRTVRPLAAACLLILLCAASVASGAGHPAPLAKPYAGVPWSGGKVSTQHRAVEAETKTRRLLAGAKLHAAGLDKASPGQELYDVEFYDLVLDIDPVAKLVTGTTTIRAEVVGASLDQMVLDLDLNMYVPAVRVGGVGSTYSRQQDVLTVDLDRTYLAGEIVSVEVDYSGNPAGEYYGWSTYGGAPLVWTLSEPYGARDWWACKDLNTDKADSVALHVTVPDNLIVASNGTLDAVTAAGPGETTYHWTERYPITTYLVSLAIHPYVVLEDEWVSAEGDTLPLVNYVVADRVAQAQAGYAVTGPMLDVFSEIFGPYPYMTEKYGHAHFPWGGGMEHQTCSSMFHSAYDEWFIAHELAHQWVGDLVTCADFSHIWINEGFATWAEAYWFEQNVGPAAYRIEMNNARYLGPGTIIVENPASISAIFDYFLSYQKASWVPHMLRRVIGETDFRAGLDLLLADYGFGSATTADVQAVFETASGQDLTTFFQQWIYGEYYPEYQVAWNSVPEGGGQSRVLLRVSQIQVQTGLFEMPLDVRISTSLGDTTFVVQNAAADQWYDFVVDGTVTGLQLDPDTWVLCEVTYDAATGVDDGTAPRATAPQLTGNVPNPFNPMTEILCSIPAAGSVRVSVHDAAGRLVRRLHDGVLPAGDHRLPWRGDDGAGRAVASGTYFVRLESPGGADVRPVTLVR